ncbi:hypothetical protein RAZWK3B_20416 [Roseobacter sp. AzwK-3b]|uniref:hypothetical protein n=1 Tax=Roseobacter sp. AzwK-3b TaxID=351016 RepID=UPI0001569993|nr:hypothetical protein [Roseobacter sp. AzwK-3b]EDM71754.1 hypothetical protein RAZWK3B_20416 [Roseobacter sp. AzwK-3b]
MTLGLADAQTGIGDIFRDGANGGEGSLGHVMLHGLAGCVAAEAQGADCGAGAAGGIAQAVYAGGLEGNTLTDEQQQQRAEMIGAAAGRFLSATLRPRITVPAGTDLAAADALHGRVHDVCFIARSVAFPVAVAARYRIAP